MTFNQRFLSFILGKESNYFAQAKQFELPTNRFPTDPSHVSVATTCVKVLAETMAGMPLHVYKPSKKDGKVKDKKSKIYDLLHSQPNKFTTSNSFFQTLEYHRNFTGNAFAIIYRNLNTGTPEKLEIVNPSQVKGYKVKNDELYYKIGEDDEEKHINAANMLHFKMMSKDGIWGLNPIEVLKMNMGITH